MADKNESKRPGYGDYIPGEALVKQDIITQQELEDARAKEEESGTPWYRQLLHSGKITFEVLEDILYHEFHPKSIREEHDQLGRTLVDMKAISQQQLEEALEEQRRNGRLLGNILLDRGWVTRRTIAKALSKQYRMEFAEADKTPSESEALEAVPESMARKNNMLPVQLEGDKLTVLVNTPQTRDALRNVGVLLSKRIHPILTDIEDMRAEIHARYRGKKGRSLLGFKRSGKEADSEKGGRFLKRKDRHEATGPGASGDEGKGEGRRFEGIAQEASGAPVVKLVSTIIEGAANSGATDIHLDPQDPETRVRYRIDGVLHDIMSIPKNIEAATVSRIKILADLDITETRHPQDGHMSLHVGEAAYDVRVATMPTFLGERIVLRLLDQTSVLAGIRDLGLEPEDEDKLRRAIDQPYGMILVTGPTGSGKTTTLYAALNQKDVMTESIVTLEDPVEYQLSGINQVQVDPDISRTFASTLRSALRQDIDVLLVGEIRDAETAHIAIRAAMTGHLVFSTLHTNDAVEAVGTLRNMGVPSYLIASALTAVAGQRLVRKVCPYCKTAFQPDSALLQSLGMPEDTRELYRGAGCENCYHTGHKGRTGVFEMFGVNQELRRLIARDATHEELFDAAQVKTMADRCRLKVARGEVNAEEFLRTVRF
ncbi:MAG: GspE/PulE family protein [Candidatus Hydrogenedentota bacterium]